MPKVRTLLREALEERAEQFLSDVDEKLVYVNEHVQNATSGEIMLEKSDREDVQQVISLSQRMFVMQKSFEQMGIYIASEVQMPFSTTVECDVGKWGITCVPDIAELLETY